MGINVSAIGAATRGNILKAIDDNDSNKNAVAKRAGIASSTFDRKLKHAETFTVKEIGQIAEALNLQLGDILGSAA